VTPGNPYQGPTLKPQTLGQIDYLVAHAWELGPFSPRSEGRFDIDVVAHRLLDYGVATVCIPISGGCTVYKEDSPGTFTVPNFPSPYKEVSASRDAFCAALAMQLIENENKFTESVVFWATAAMAATTADYPIANSLPTRQRVEQILDGTRYTVRPREP
jgi:ribokinase